MYVLCCTGGFALHDVSIPASKAVEAAQQQIVITKKTEEAPKKVETPVVKALTTATTATCD
jgi:hypothetical protein